MPSQISFTRLYKPLIPYSSQAPAPSSPDAMDTAEEHPAKSSSVKYLRSQLLAAHAAIANLAAELDTCKAKLAKYEKTS